MLLTPIEISYLVLLALFWICLLVYAFRVLYPKYREDKNRYRLYKIRDELTYLVASDDLSPDGFLFREFYPMVNSFIQNIHRFTLSEILTVLRSEERRIETENFVKQVVEELKSSSDNVNAVINEIPVVMMKTLVDNSLFLRLLVMKPFRILLLYLANGKHRWLITFFRKITNFFAGPFSESRQEAYIVYRALDNFGTKLQLARC